GNCRRAASDPRNRVRERGASPAARHGSTVVAADAKSHSRPVGLPPCRPIGRAIAAERSRSYRQSDAPLTRIIRPSGPRRAQAREQVARDSVRYQRRSLVTVVFGLLSRDDRPAHAVTSRVTSWAFWLSRCPSSVDSWSGLLLDPPQLLRVLLT